MEITVSLAERRAVESWLRAARPVSGLAALPESKRQKADRLNAKLRQRLSNQRRPRA